MRARAHVASITKLPFTKCPAVQNGWNLHQTPFSTLFLYNMHFVCIKAPKLKHTHNIILTWWPDFIECRASETITIYSYIHIFCIYEKVCGGEAFCNTKRLAFCKLSSMGDHIIMTYKLWFFDVLPVFFKPNWPKRKAKQSWRSFRPGRVG